MDGHGVLELLATVGIIIDVMKKNPINHLPLKISIMVPPSSVTLLNYGAEVRTGISISQLAMMLECQQLKDLETGMKKMEETQMMTEDVVLAQIEQHQDSSWSNMMMEQ